MTAALTRMADLADAKLYSLIELMQPVMTSDRLTAEQRQTINWLSVACIRSSGSTLLLVGFGRVWDAEIVSRSVFEATMKFCHLLGDETKIRERFFEYEQSLSDIAALSDHQKAQLVIDLAPTESEAMTAPMAELLLSEEKADQIRNQYPRQLRRQLKSSWGFTGLIQTMVSSGEGLGGVASGFSHGYAMASHVAHADFIGIGMVMEREYRSDERRDAANLGHAARVISDQLWYFAFRLIIAYRFIDKPRKQIFELMKDGSEIWELLEDAQRQFFEVEYPDD